MNEQLIKELEKELKKIRREIEITKEEERTITKKIEYYENFNKGLTSFKILEAFKLPDIFEYRIIERYKGCKLVCGNHEFPAHYFFVLMVEGLGRSVYYKLTQVEDTDCDIKLKGEECYKEDLKKILEKFEDEIIAKIKRERKINA